MSGVGRWFGWVPPFLVGMSGALAGVVAMALLLHSGGGFLDALVVLLATLLGGLALGLWVSRAPDDGPAPDRLRRRWLLVLATFTAAAVAAGGWSLFGGLESAAVTRGLALALLAALPLYGVGALLGEMATVGAGGPAADGGPGAPAAAGAAFGALLAGRFLIRVLHPPSVYVLCLVLLSGGALVHGWLLPPPRDDEEDPAGASEAAGADDHR